MKTMSKSRLKAEMLGVFRQLEKSGEELVVTDHGRPVLKIVPVEAKKPTIEALFADVRGKVIYHGDIMTPTIEEWTET